VSGITTTLPFFREVVRDEEFVAAQLDTGFIARFNERRALSGIETKQIESDLAAIAAGLSYALRQRSSVQTTTHTSNRWKMAGRNAGLRMQPPITSSKWRKS
jgi:acetyl/propionyl-CoA carboxylase alpha subunit